MRNAIPLLFTITAGFGLTRLAASTICQPAPIDDPPLADYLLGEAPASPISIDSSADALDGAVPEASVLRSAALNAPFMIEAWVQPVDDCGGSSGARAALGQVADYKYALRPAQAGSPNRAGTAIETSTLTLLGLVLIMFGLAPRGWRTPLKFSGGDAGLSHARIFRIGGVSLRRRSESELNSFSACYATTTAPADVARAACAVPVALRRAAIRYTRH